MKKYGFIGVILLLVAAFTMLFTTSVVAAPTMKDKGELDVFNGHWLSIRDGHEQSLKIKCKTKNNTCRMKLIAEESDTCFGLHGEPTDAMLIGRGPVQVDGSSITIWVDAYCLTSPPVPPNMSFPVTYTYIEGDGTLVDNLEVVWNRK